MVRKMDAGDMISQVVMPIGENTTYGMLESEMRVIGSEAILDVIHAFSAGVVNAIPQEEKEVTFAPKIELEDCEINWRKSSETIHNLIRGVNPEPGAWCRISVDGILKRLKIFESRLSNVISIKSKACIMDPSKKILVGCDDGALELLDVQLEGKKRMSAADFYRGLPAGKWEII
jgi:methionyl-tRNA formyltransferase